MGMYGNIATMSVEDVLGWMSIGKTGVLTLNTEVETKRLYVWKGQLVYAQSNIYSERLSGHLLKSNLIQVDLVTNLVAKFEGDDRAFGEALLDGGHVAVDQLGTAVRHLVQQIFYSIFAWSKGVFLYVDQQIPFHKVWPIKIGLSNEIMEGARLADEHRRLKQEVEPYLASMFRIVKENRKALQTKLHQLGADGQAIFKLIRGMRTLEEIVYLHSQREFETLTTVKMLVDENLVEPYTNPGGRDSESSGDYTLELVGRADGFLKEGRLLEALSAYEEIVRLIPNHPAREHMEKAASQLFENHQRTVGESSKVPRIRQELALADPEHLLLSPMCKAVYKKLDGKATIKDVADQLHMPLADAYRAIARLLEMGYVGV